MNKIILFGAGQYGKRALAYYGKERVCYFVDNNKEIVGEKIEGVSVISFDKLKDIYENYEIVVTVDARKCKILAKQLEESGIRKYKLFIDVIGVVTKGSIQNKLDYNEIIRKTDMWIKTHSIEGEGIISNTSRRKSYPEVTGYYIPSLLRWGERERARKYAKWLCEIQREDGAWCGAENEIPYVFDTAQVLKGLLAIRNIDSKVDKSIKSGCEWLLSCMDENGRLITPDKSLWGEYGDCSELVHLYCLEPLYMASRLYGISKYEEAANKIKKYYLDNYMEDILNFNLLSHFYAYVIEGLCDIGETEVAQKAMQKVSMLQREDGMVPAYKNVNWVCSTGLFQFAIIWYKLGEVEKGNRAFKYACSLQNSSGGWYGSYATKEQVNGGEIEEYPTYFAESEISWAVKYFMDALYYKCVSEFETMTEEFHESIDKSDGRYQFILEEIKKVPGKKRICDAGCGKGRYLYNLVQDTQGNCFSGMDLSESVLKKIDLKIETKQGSLTQCPYEDEEFDIVYTVEALEHAIYIENAINELLRITKKGGKVIIVDKNNAAKGMLEIEEWEQWFSDELFECYADKLGYYLEIVSDISYDNGMQDGLFSGWILKK